MNWLAITCITTGEQLQEYINQFKLNVIQAKFDETKDAATLISYFLTGIPIGLMQHVQAMDTVPTTTIGWYEKAAHFCFQGEIAYKIAMMHQGPVLQNPHPNFTHHPQTSRLTQDPTAMDIDALNLSLIEQSRCL